MSRELVGTLLIRARKRDVQSFLREYEGLQELGLGHGNGYVEFDSFRAAKRFLENSRGKAICGESISLESEKHQRPTVRAGELREKRTKVSVPSLAHGQTRHRVVVENLTDQTTWKDLKDYFRRAGDVTYANAHKKGLGKGIVEYATRFGVNKAIRTLNETLLKGRKIRVINEKVYDCKTKSPPNKSPAKKLHNVQPSTKSPSSRRKQLRLRSFTPKSGKSVTANSLSTKTRLASRTSKKQAQNSSTVSLRSNSQSSAVSSSKKKVPCKNKKMTKQLAK